MGDLSLEDKGKARWDAYRLAYPDMSYLEVAAAHDWVWENYPDQSHHTEEAMDAFFRAVPARGAVVEVGGWRGEAAARTLTNHPDIRIWRNFEICRGAVENPVTDDPRYHGIWPTRWVWELPPPTVDTAVLAHVIEHVSDQQLPLLLDWTAKTMATSIYIEAPISEEGRGWYGSNTAHLLTLGWAEVRRLLDKRGYYAMISGLARVHHGEPYSYVWAAKK